MTVWKSLNTSLENWTTIGHALSQHRHLLEVGGHPCKVLIKNFNGEKVGTENTPIPVTAFDTSIDITGDDDITRTFPGKVLWTFGDDVRLFPDIRSIKTTVDNINLDESFDGTTMSGDTEFFIVHNRNLVDTPDSISIYFNENFDLSGKEVTYYYTTLTPGVDMATLQPKDVEGTYRSLHGYTQYLDPTATHKGVSYPHSLLMSFPVTPPFDTTYSPFGSNEQWLSRAWTLGSEVQLHNGDIIYRASDDKWFEVIDYEPNLFFYKGEWKLLTQSFGVTHLGPNDVLRSYPLI